MVEYMLARGANIAPVTGGISAISEAASAGNTDVVRLLLSHADEEARRRSEPALNWAAARGDLDMVKLLIENGFDVNASTSDGNLGSTPLLAACLHMKDFPECMTILKLLLRNGADTTARNYDDKTAAEILAENHSIRGDLELQQLLAGIL